MRCLAVRCINMDITTAGATMPPTIPNANNLPQLDRCICRLSDTPWRATRPAYRSDRTIAIDRRHHPGRVRRGDPRNGHGRIVARPFDTGVCWQLPAYSPHGIGQSAPCSAPRIRTVCHVDRIRGIRLIAGSLGFEEPAKARKS